MKRLCIVIARWRLGIWLLALNVPAISADVAEVAATSRRKAPPIELKDQHGRTQVLAFPKARLTVLTVADHKGSKQIDSWVQPLKQRYRDRIDISGVADLGVVPRILHSAVRERFQKQIDYPVMLDWSGAVAKALLCRKDQVNVLALDGQGQIMKHLAGPATEKSLAELYAALDHSLAAPLR